MTTRIVTGRSVQSGARLFLYGAGVLAGLYAAHRGTAWLRAKYLKHVWEGDARPAPTPVDRFDMASRGDLDPQC